MKRNILLTFTILILSCFLCSAMQNMSGMYIMKSGNVQLYLAIQQNGDQVTGGLTSTTGTELKLQGKVMGSFCQGKCYDSQGQVFFNCYLEGDEMYLQLIDPGADGNPDYSRLKELVFKKKGSIQTPQQPAQPATPFQPSSPSTAQTPSMGNPLSPGTGNNPLARKSVSPFTGSFSGDGLELTLKESNGRVTGKMTFSGQTFVINAVSDNNNMSGSFKTTDGEFKFNASLNNSVLKFETGGTAYTLKKVSSGQPVNPLMQKKKKNPLAESRIIHHPLTPTVQKKEFQKTEMALVLFLQMDGLHEEIPGQGI